MAHFPFQNDELEYVDEFYEMSDFEDEGFSLSGSVNSTPKPKIRKEHGCFDSDVDDDDDDDEFLLDSVKSKTDTTANEARNGKDIQGIPWERLNFTRDKYRETRLKQYKNFDSVPPSSLDGLHKVCKKVEKGYKMYDFQFNTRLVKSTIVHFQLRNLLWATSKHDLYLVHHYSILHWSPLLKRSKEVLDVAKPIVPTTKSPRSFPVPLSRVQISTMCVKDNLLVAGGFHGELVCKYLNEHVVAFSTKVTTDENAITNTVDTFYSPGGSRRVITGNNDARVRIFDVSNFVCINSFSFPWSVNNVAASPDGKLMAILGDNTECLISDAESGKVVSTLKGHLDFSFASAWHPDGRILATGNQDTTCRLWDIRNMSQSLEVLKGRMGAIRTLKFSSDGRYLAMSEPADFVHVFDTKYGYEKEQEIDLFGEIAGVCFSPDDEALFIGVADRTYGSVLEFNRRSHNNYLEAMF